MTGKSISSGAADERGAKPLKNPAKRTDPATARAVEESLELAAERKGDLTAPVYALLFQRQPAMEVLFARDTKNTIKGEMLMRVFEAILDFVGERRYAHHLIGSEAVTHEGYEVPRETFATFFGIVREVVHDACGSEWTQAMDNAWDQLLADLAHYVNQPLVSA